MLRWRVLFALLLLYSRPQNSADASPLPASKKGQGCGGVSRLNLPQLPSYCQPRRLLGNTTSDQEGPIPIDHGPIPIDQVELRSHISNILSLPGVDLSAINSSSDSTTPEDSKKSVWFRVPTREEAEAIRAKCTASLPAPKFPPWNPPPDYLRAELWSIRTMVELKDSELRDFYLANDKYYLDNGGHSDIRFRDEKKINSHEWVQARFAEMLAAFMDFCDRLDFHPIIAHGSLLGLSWTNRMTEYDDDVDLQIAYQELEAMVAWNQTVLGDDFLLDINPHFRVRHVEYRDNNVIDARLIDKASGLFIDITALSDLNPNIWPMRVSCKSPHVYNLDALFPVRRSIFEGVEVWIPNDVTQVLGSEYRLNGYSVGPFNNHKFNFLTSAWEKVKSNVRSRIARFL